MIRTRSNKAKRDKGAILADTKNLLSILHVALQHMPKIERIEGAPCELKRACYDLIRHYNTAMDCPEVRLEYIHRMFGDFGVILAAFDLCIRSGFFTDTERLHIAEQLKRIEEGIKKWRNATRSPKSQEQQTVTESKDTAEVAVSND